ncbi:MAG: hypothetical protein H9Q67_03860 [Spiroplasma ixodetis]|nr:hypothetical protein [Spiroplasma ixodetis]
MYELGASNGYLLDTLLYTGKGTITNDEKGHAYAVVQKLIKNYNRKGHALYIDNFYTSIPLSEDLLKLGTQITSTLGKNRKGIPNLIKNQRLKQGKSIFMQIEAILIQRWRDKRNIYAILTRHNNEFRCVKQKSNIKVLKSKAIAEYNMHMGVVGRCD